MAPADLLDRSRHHFESAASHQLCDLPPDLRHVRAFASHCCRLWLFWNALRRHSVSLSSYSLLATSKKKGALGSTPSGLSFSISKSRIAILAGRMGHDFENVIHCVQNHFQNFPALCSLDSVLRCRLSIPMVLSR